MAQSKKRDHQIFKLFVTLAVLTILLVFGLKVVLFGPIIEHRDGEMLPISIPAQR
jgi:hypothetical protein